MPWTHRAFWITPIAIGLLLWLFSAILARGFFRRAYESASAETVHERLFLASIGFFTAAFVVRGITLAIHYDIGPFHDVSMRGRHIHHLVWGILLLLLVGFGWLLQVGTGAAKSNVLSARLMCMLYGVGAALTLDEFALWLNLRDVYWEREGRESVEAMALFAGVLFVGIFGGRFFRGAARGSPGAGPRRKME
ncbi:MAG TPA: hypothetical protein VHW24_06175 [Bryobacteraceae bacterium]|jgi:hypothetical protein|nr:hypothetical protein [Bryobacteraceae bacterium]